MREEISRLVDGELPDEQYDSACGELKQGEGMATWVCYHVIGETLREGSPGAAPPLSQRLLARLEAEPTVMAPRPRRFIEQPMQYAWAAAATLAAVALTGWVATSVVEPNGKLAFAKAREAAQVRAAQLRPSSVPQDYLMAHQEYSPATPLQGLGPTVRTISVQSTDGRQ
ncbi:MAG: sigma-E factor negative regulatory protein [Pseudomonadota bacterium]|nr:sigma-E factor negative regulatory protein [Pseudomonadota bacterium]